MPSSPGSRTLTVTISIDGAKAISDIEAIQNSLAGLAAAATAAGGFKFATAGGAGGTGAAAKTISELQDQLRGLAATSPKAAKALDAAIVALGKVAPLGEEATQSLGKAYRTIDSMLAITRRAGGGDQLISQDMVNKTKERLSSLRESVQTTKNALVRDLREISAKPTVDVQNAFDKMAEKADKSGKKLEKSYGDLIKIKDRFYRGDASVTDADISKANDKYMSALRAHGENLRNLASAGTAVRASASAAATAATELKSKIDAAKASGEAAKASLSRLGDGVAKSLEGVAQRVANIGSAPSKSVSTALTNLRKQAERDFKAVEDARDKAFKVKIDFLQGNASGGDVKKAFDAYHQAGQRLAGTLAQLRQANVAYEASARSSAASTAALEAGLKRIGQASSSTKQAISVMGESVKQAVEKVNQEVANIGVSPNKGVRVNFQNLVNQITRDLGAYDSAKQKAYDTQAAMLKGKATPADLASDMAKVREAGTALSASYGQLTNAGNAVIDSSRTLSKTLLSNQQNLDMARRSAYAWSIAGYQMQATLGVITQYMKDSVSSFAEFDYTVRRAAGALGIFDQTGAAFDNLGQAIQNTAVQAKLFDPNEIAKGYYYWGSTTGQVVQSQEDLLNIQKQVLPVMQMAAITQTDLESSLKGVYAVMQQYSLPMEDARAVTEKLFLVSQKTAAEVPDLLESFKMVGPIANELGVSFDDVIGMLGALSNAGIKGSMAGRALRQTFIKLTDPTVRASKALDEATANTYGLGKSFSDLVFPDGKFIGMQGYLDVLSNLTKDLTEQERNRLLGIITTNNELPALTKLISANTKAMKENRPGVVESAKAMYSAAEAAKVFAGSVENQMNSAQAVFSQLGIIVSSVAIEIGKNIWEMVRPFMQAAIEIGKMALVAIQTNPVIAKLASSIVLITGVLVALGSTALIGMGSMKLLHAVLTFDLIPSFKAAFDAGTGLAGIIKTIANGFVTLITTVGRFLLTNPLGWLILFIGYIIIASGHFDDFIKVVGDVLGVIGKIGEQLATLGANLVLGALSDIAKLTSEIAGNIWDWIDRFIKANFAAKDVKDTIDAINGSVPNGNKPKNGGARPAGRLDLPKPEGVWALGTGATFGNGPQQSEAQQAAKNMAERAARARADWADENAWANSAVMAAKAYSDSFGNQIGEGLGGAIKKAFKSGNSAYAAAAIEGVTYYMDAQIKAWGELVSPQIKSLVEGLKNLLNSDNTWATKLGAALTDDIAKAVQSGDISKVQPAISRMLNSVHQKLLSGNKQNQEDGRAGLRALLMGFTQMDGLNASQIGLLGLAISKLATPGLEKEAYELARQFLLTIGVAIQTGQAAMAMSPGRRKYLGDQAMANMNAEIEKIWGKPKDDKGGGGGGSGNTQSPLEKALEVAKNAVELADALAKLDGVNVKAMVQKSMKPIAEAMLLADKITYDVTRSFGKKRLQEVADFSDATGKLASLIGSALDAFGKMEGYRRPPVKLFKDIAADLVVMVNVIKGSAAHFKAKGLAAAAAFADAAGPIVTLIGSAFDVFSKFGQSEFTAVPANFITDLTALIGQLVTAVGEVGQQISGPLQTAAKTFSDNAGPVMSLISGVFDAFSKTADFVVPTQGAINVLRDTIKMSVLALGEIAKDYSSPETKTTLKNITEFATAVSPVMDAIKSTFDAFAGAVRKQPDTQNGESWQAVDVNQIVEQIDMSFSAIKGLIAKYKDNNFIQDAKDIAATASAVVAAVSSFFDLGSKGTTTDGEGNKSNDPSQIANLINIALTNILTTMQGFVGEFKTLGGSIITNLADGMKSQEGVLMDEVRAINSILASMGASITISAGGQSISMTVNAEANKVTVRHEIVDPNGAVASMTPDQRERFISSGTQFINNITQSAATI